LSFPAIFWNAAKRLLGFAIQSQGDFRAMIAILSGKTYFIWQESFHRARLANIHNPAIVS
tara:strand:+ start:3014 stop:3193 length:180 start_codon:yes stop_codon:yes gene_type:complete